MTAVEVYPPARLLDDGARITVAVLIAAYRAERWIGECLRALDEQVLPTELALDLRVGVDACDATSAELCRLGVVHWRPEQNVGPYVLRNSLAALGPADAYAVFDADDVMEPTYLSETLRAALPDGIGGAARFQGGNRAFRYQHGVATFSAAAWRALGGGYANQRLAADYDMIERAKLAGIRVTGIPRPLYTRRLHEDSLVARFPIRGAERREAVRKLDEDRRKGRAPDVATVPLVRVHPSGAITPCPDRPEPSLAS